MVTRKKLPSNDMADVFAEDSTDEKKLPSNKQLQELGELANKVANLDEKIIQKENELKNLRKEYNDVATNKIPDLFDEFGLSKLTLTDGTFIEINRKYAASITKENQSECFKWLKKHKFDSLIKHQLISNLKKGENKEAAEILKLCKKLGVTYVDKKSVHPNTLSAFVKEQIESGADFPQELFKVFPIRIAKVNLGTM